MFMKTIQEKEFNFDDILLYNVVKDQIIMIVNDPEQMKIFNYTGLTQDAPISRIPYTKDAEYEIISKMKKIRSYKTVDNYIDVVYTDKTRSKFDISNEEVIRKILDAQTKVSLDIISANWANVPEEKKVEEKKKASSKWKKGVAALLAAIVLLGVAKKDEIKEAIDARALKNENANNPTQNEAVVEFNNEETYNSKDNEYYLEVSNYDFTELGKQLYAETITKENLVLKYQQVVDINWDEDLAIKVVEFMNGKYPTTMLNMSDPDATLRTTEIQQAWSLLITGNLNPETNAEGMIDFANYFIREEDKVLVNNAMAVSRNAMDESLGQPMNGFILDEKDYASINKFSREYLGAVDQLLNYEYDTMRDIKFEQMSSGARWTISTIFQQVNNTVPQWSYIVREKDGVDKNIYYRRFVDVIENKEYLPMPGENGTVDYRCEAEGKTYNEYEMFAMAGMSLLEEQRNVQNIANPNIHQDGIQVLVDNAVDKAREDVFDLRAIANRMTNTTVRAK